VGDDDSWRGLLVEDGEQVLGVIDHRGRRPGVQRAAVAAAVVRDDPVIGQVGEHGPEAASAIRGAVHEHDGQTFSWTANLDMEPSQAHRRIVVKKDTFTATALAAPARHRLRQPRQVAAGLHARQLSDGAGQSRDVVVAVALADQAVLEGGGECPHR
jgi:hypothetical protein